MKTTSSSPLFATYKPGTIRGGTVGGSHLNQWLAAVATEAESAYDEWCEKGNTKINKRKVIDESTSDSESLENAVNRGITFTMIRNSIERKYKNLPGLLARGLNVEHHVGEGHMHDCRLTCFFAKMSIVV